MTKNRARRTSLIGGRLLHAFHHGGPGQSRAAHIGAGWSSPVARQAHNLKVVGSNPTPATNFYLVRSIGWYEFPSGDLFGKPSPATSRQPLGLISSGRCRFAPSVVPQQLPRFDVEAPRDPGDVIN